MKPGDRLYLVQRTGQNHEVTVATVDKRLVWLDNGMRLNPENMLVFDGQRLAGACFSSEAEYRGQEDIRDAWSEFLRVANGKTDLSGLTLTGIEQALAWLGVGE